MQLLVDHARKTRTPARRIACGFGDCLACIEKLPIRQQFAPLGRGSSLLAIDATFAKVESQRCRMTHTLRERATLRNYNGLTPEMRTWLAAQSADIRLDDFILMFRNRFQVTPEEAGELLGLWARVKWAELPKGEAHA